ncbi:flagellar assembly protein FliH [Fibrobacteres bacterium R8-0-B4]
MPNPPPPPKPQLAQKPQETIVNENVSVLLDQLLKAEDPATIGIRRILRHKIDETNSFPLQTETMEPFDIPGGKGGKSHIFTEQERSYLELEKRVREVERALTQERLSGKRAVADTHEKGKAEGFAAGEKSGYDKAKAGFDAEIAKHKDQMSKYLKQLEDSKKTMINGLEHILLRFCVELTKKIISCELETNKEMINATIKRALALIADRENLLIRVSPGDMETASGNKDFLSSVTERLENVKIEEDARIGKGGCIIESNSGLVDARLGVQLEEVEALVEKAWESSDMAV